MFSVMRFRQFEIFHAIMTAGSVSAAAERLGVSQPSVTKTLQQLEDELGYLLFDRVRGRLHPTEEARILMTEAIRTQAALDDLRDLSKRLQHGADSHLRLVATPALGHEVLPEAAAAFSTENPAARMTISTLHSGALLNEIAKPAYGYDIGFVFDAEARPASVGARQIGTVPIAAIAPKGELDRAGPGIVIDDLVGRSLIGLDESEPLGKLVADLSRTAGLTIDTPVRVQTYRLACAMALRGAGIAIVDSMTAASFVRNNPYVDVRRFPESLDMPVNVVFPLARGLPIRSRELVARFEGALQSQVQLFDEELSKRTK